MTPRRSSGGPLLPHHEGADEREALRFGERALTHGELRGAAAHVAARIGPAEPHGSSGRDPGGAAVPVRVAVWAVPELETCVAVAGALAAVAPVVPVNPKAGERELAHIAADAASAVVLAPPGAVLPPALAALPRADVDVDARAEPPPEEPDPAAPALIVYTSGTTGPPKGVVLSRRAIAANLDAVADAWDWTAADVLVHGLPLFHVHGLVLGILGPLRLGGSVHHLGRFTSRGVADALAGPGTMLFAVPTMYHRLVADAETDPTIAAALRGARLLVSGSAALPAADHARIERACGQRVVERYGMTETLMTTATRADGERRPGTVGAPLPGVELRLVGDDGAVLDPADPDAIGEIQVRSPSLFLEYLNRPDATAEGFTDGWFRTGDVATRDADGAVRIVGRLATDLIKSGGFKIGAGEIESALLEHPAVLEAAVTGEPDDDLGERIVAWIVPAPGHPVPDGRALADHVAGLLAPHKRPRAVRVLDALPRNALGKVQKARLRRE
jgi:malonyl-CoA/methylmalonyl-CoA synthetase